MTPTTGSAPTCPQAVSVPLACLLTDSAIEKLNSQARRELDRVLSEPPEYVAHKTFANARTARKLYGREMDCAGSFAKWRNSDEAAPPPAAAAGPAKTLRQSEEQRLFQRMNYARYRTAKLLRRHAGKHLTAAAARELLWWHAQASVARCRIVQANVPLVLAMAKRTRLGNVDFAELISEGNMALLRSVDKFDCSRGFKFSTYACRAILKSFSRVAMRTARYRGRFPTEFDPTLEKSHYQEEQRELHEAECVDELRGLIRNNAADLNEVEVKVLQARFALCQVDGLEGDGPKTLEQVGLLIGVTKERVRQIQNKALAKLRSKLQEDFLAA